MHLLPLSCLLLHVRFCVQLKHPIGFSWTMKEPPCCCRSAGANGNAEQQQVVADSGQALVTAMSQHPLLLGGFTFEYSDEPWKGEPLPPLSAKALRMQTRVWRNTT